MQKEEELPEDMSQHRHPTHTYTRFWQKHGPWGHTHRHTHTHTSVQGALFRIFSFHLNQIRVDEPDCPTTIHHVFFALALEITQISRT